MPSASVPADLDRGRRIGKYEILTRLSMGGMAELFLAYTAGPGGFRKFVAVKQILPDIKKDDSFVKMFLDEARITAAFNQANIGQVFDLGEQDGELYLAMEFISGQNLEQIVKRAAKRQVLLPIGFSARVVRDACLALHYAHHFTEPSGRPAPVVHRDVSPKNVMVTYSGDVKMIDFGIAKAKNRLNRTQVGIVKGTSGYMSPEQVRNETLDGRTDLFAAAVMLHELLTSSRLFTAPTDAAMMMKIVEGEVQQPRNLNPKVSAALSEVVMKGLSRKREARFSTGKEFARAIEQACPEMFDDDRSSALMTELFDDKIQTTRALLELANTDDAGGMTKAVELLVTGDEGQDGTPRPRKTAAKRQATPTPREGLATPARGRSQKVPANPPEQTDEQAALDGDATIPPRSKKNPTANRYASSVNRDYAMYSESDAETEQAKSKLQRPVAKRADTHDIPAVRARVPARRGEEPKKGGLGTLLFVVAFFALLGGVVWAGWKGPLKDTGPAVALREWLDLEVNGPPPAEPPADLRTLAAQNANGSKPQWLVDKEAHEAVLKAEQDPHERDRSGRQRPRAQGVPRRLERHVEAARRSGKRAARAENRRQDRSRRQQAHRRPREADRRPEERGHREAENTSRARRRATKARSRWSTAPRRPTPPISATCHCSPSTPRKQLYMRAA